MRSDQGIKAMEGHIKFEEDLAKLSAISLPCSPTWLGIQRNSIEKFNRKGGTE